MKSTIILGAHNDFHAQYMLTACNENGLNAHLFDTSTYPQSCSISWEPNQQSGFLNLASGDIAFDSINSVFWSTIGFRNTDLTHQELSGAIALNDATSVLKTLFFEQRIRWCNSWHSMQFHKVKPRQLALAKDLGLSIPPTYVGNDKVHLKNFVSHHKNTVYKPVYGGAHCAKVSEAQLSDWHLDRVLKVSPVTIQKYIQGEDIRTYVIADKVFSARIESDALDYRVDHNARLIPVELPDNLAILAKRLTKAFGMLWTAIDWRCTPDQQFFFLEANPSPMFIHFEQQTGFPITANLLSLLKS